jgi:RNA polymerase sigma factor (sigma-70 family)
VEASALQAPAGLARNRISLGAPLLRLRSDQQLVALFRAGNDEAFRVIHDRYRHRLFAYARQMLAHRQDAEDALQDVFVRAYAGLRANDRELALRAWLYRVAHNRCIDELRRPAPPPTEVLELLRSPVHDPIAQADQRESLRRLIADVRRLPHQQRSALLMRELAGMSYADVAAALGMSVPAVKSVLVRARVALAKASEARDAACSDIREELTLAHDRGVRPGAMARRHMRDCAGCRQYRGELRGISKQFAALIPALGPMGALANALGFGGGAGGGALAAGGAAGTASVGALTAGAGHVATLIAAAVVTAGGAVEIQHTIAAPANHRHQVSTARAARSAAHSIAGEQAYRSGASTRQGAGGSAASSGADASAAPLAAASDSKVSAASNGAQRAGAAWKTSAKKGSSTADGSRADATGRPGTSRTGLTTSGSATSSDLVPTGGSTVSTGVVTATSETSPATAPGTSSATTPGSSTSTTSPGTGGSPTSTT